MKTLIYSIIAATLVLIGCFLISLIRKTRTKKDQKYTNLLFPSCILLLFVSLFVVAGISRNHITKEVTLMQNTDDTRLHVNRSRLDLLEKRNKTISWIIGKDEDLEKKIKALATS